MGQSPPKWHTCTKKEPSQTGGPVISNDKLLAYFTKAIFLVSVKSPALSL